MATFTSSELTSTPKNAPEMGLVARSSVCTASVTGAANSIVLLAKVPNGATVHHWHWFIDDAGDDQTWSVGYRYPEGSSSYSTTASILGAAQSVSSVVPANVLIPNGQLPVKISFSQGERESYVWIVGKASAAISESMVSKFTIFYSMD